MTLAQLRQQMQQYIDESSIESDNMLEGLDVSEPAAVELFNDFLQFLEATTETTGIQVGGQYEPIKSNVEQTDQGQ